MTDGKQKNPLTDVQFRAGLKRMAQNLMYTYHEQWLYGDRNTTPHSEITGEMREKAWSMMVGDWLDIPAPRGAG